MNLYVIRRRDVSGTPEELQKTAARSAEVGEEMSDDIKWIRTYVVQEESGKLGTVCLYEGSSAEKVREQAERTGMPADEVAQVVDTVIVNADPVQAAAGSEAAASRPAMSSFFMANIACMTRWETFGSDSSSFSRSGTICHETPKRSVSQPHGPSSPPSLSVLQ